MCGAFLSRRGISRSIGTTRWCVSSVLFVTFFSRSLPRHTPAQLAGATKHGYASHRPGRPSTSAASQTCAAGPLVATRNARSVATVPKARRRGRTRRSLDSSAHVRSSSRVSQLFTFRSSAKQTKLEPAVITEARQTANDNEAHRAVWVVVNHPKKVLLEGVGVCRATWRGVSDTPGAHV